VRATTRWACLTLVAAVVLGCAGEEQAVDAPAGDRPGGSVTEAPGVQDPPVGDRPADPDPPAGDRPADPDPEADPGLLDFTARALGGGTIDAGSYAGGHVVLWMWAPW
jgi:hypothetical protein